MAAGGLLAMTRRKIAVASTPPDGVSDKRFPNGIRVLAQALWQFWPGVSGEVSTDRMSLGMYADNSRLADVARTLKGMYPGADGRTLNNPQKVLNDIGLANKDLTYLHLRLMAEFIDIPVSLMLFFCHLVSVERTASKEGNDPRSELLYLLDKVDAFSAAARNAANRGTPDVFLRRYAIDDGKEEYLADLNTLWNLVQSVNLVRKKRHASARHNGTSTSD
jgi:hypothetical protein